MVVIKCGKNETSEQVCDIDLNYRGNEDDEDFYNFDYKNYTNYVVQITSINQYNTFFTSEVNNGKFTVRSKFDGPFFWTVFCDEINFNIFGY